MNIKPLHDRVLVRRIDEVTKTNGGIIIPDTAKEKPSEGIVEAVGNGRISPDGKIIAMTIKTGDRVLFGKYAGTEVKLDGEARLLIREDDILAVVE